MYNSLYHYKNVNAIDYRSQRHDLSHTVNTNFIIFLAQGGTQIWIGRGCAGSGLKPISISGGKGYTCTSFPEIPISGDFSENRYSILAILLQKHKN